MTNAEPVKKHIFKKSLGQHFLEDRETILRIIDLVQPDPNDFILEIGPGNGALTEPLAESGAQITAIEIDRELTDQLALRFDKKTNIEIINQNILDFDFLKLRKKHEKWKLVGNLPYNISTQLIMRVLSYTDLFTLMAFMVQKEVGNRLVAPPGNKSYGRLSVMAQRSSSLTWCLDVAPEKFFPVPKVWSSVVQIRPITLSSGDNFDSCFQRTVREAFSHRRKTLANALKSLLTSKEIKAVGIDPIIRPEQLGVTEFETLAKVVQHKKMRIEV